MPQPTPTTPHAGGHRTPGPWTFAPGAIPFATVTTDFSSGSALAFVAHVFDARTGQELAVQSGAGSTALQSFIDTFLATSSTFGKTHLGLHADWNVPASPPILP